MRDSETSRSSKRTSKSSRLRKSKLRTPEMRTRSPSIAIRGMTATSGRHSRSCEGSIVDHAARTTRYTAANAASFAALRRVHSAQAENARNAAASPMRSHAPGKSENQMASVAQTTNPTRSRNHSVARSQDRSLVSHEARFWAGRRAPVVIARGGTVERGLHYNAAVPCG